MSDTMNALLLFFTSDSTSKVLRWHKLNSKINHFDPPLQNISRAHEKVLPVSLTINFPSLQRIQE